MKNTYGNIKKYILLILLFLVIGCSLSKNDDYLSIPPMLRNNLSN